MKDINLIFIGAGYNNFYQAQVKIYDNDQLICCKNSYNGRINLCLESNKVYKTHIKTINNYIITSFYVNDFNNNYYFNINCNYIKNRIITFLLTDYNYDNLKIGKGELIVWQKV